MIGRQLKWSMDFVCCAGETQGGPKYQNIGYIVGCWNSRLFSVFGAYQPDRKLEGVEEYVAHYLSLSE